MIKTIITTVASIGVGQVVSNVVKATTPRGANTAVKVASTIGGIVISQYAGTKLSEYVEGEYDELAGSIKERQRIKKSSKSNTCE